MTREINDTRIWTRWILDMGEGICRVKDGINFVCLNERKANVGGTQWGKEGRWH